MKRIMALLTTAALLCGCTSAAVNGKSAATVVTSLSERKSGPAAFIHPEGYGVTAPADFAVDEALLPLELRLEREDCVIELIRQPLDGVSAETYSSYSNGFLANDKLHILDERRELTLAGREALLTRWHRERAGEGDRNYYAVADIYGEGEVYSVTIKADRPVEELDFDFLELMNSLAVGEAAGKTQPLAFPAEKRSPMNAETAALYEDYFGENASRHWGLYYHRQPVDGMEKFEALERSVGKMDLALLYTEIYDEYDPYMVYGGLVNAWESGKVCEVTLQLDIDSDESDVYEVLRGEHDGFLRAYAADIARVGHPVLLRPFNEMNGEWCNYSGYLTSRDPDVYIRLYKYVHKIFEDCGADNIIWVWNPNEKSYPDFVWNHEALYYPGDEYVDVVGLSGYNTGTGIDGEIWRSFEEIYDGYYERMDRCYGKPMMITEFGCAAEGGDKLAWVRDMFRALPEKYPKLRTAVWLHERNTDSLGKTTRSFFLDDTSGLPELFREELARFRGE